MLRLVAWITLVTITMITLVSAMLLVGTSRGDDSFTAYLEAHLQKMSGIWCWRGICPKRTSFTQAKLQIQAFGEKILQNQIANLLIELRPAIYLNFYSMDSSESSPITVIDIDLRQNAMLLGDTYRVFGVPMLVWLGTNAAPISQRGLCFRGGVCAYFEGSDAKLSPFTSVMGLSIYGSNTVIAEGYRPWTGYISLR